MKKNRKTTAKKNPNQSTQGKELNDQQVTKVSAGYTQQKPDGTLNGGVISKWDVKSGIP